MRKILAILLLLVISAGIVACQKPDTDADITDPPASENGTDDKTEEKTALEKVEEMLKLEYKKTTVNITTVTFGFELTSKYEISEDSVSYYVERLNLLPEDASLSSSDPSYKSTVKGDADIVNGKIVKLDENDVTLPELSELNGEFNLDADNLENVTEEAGRILADVKSAKNFLNKETEAKNMKIEVIFTESEIQSITLKYDLNDSAVQTRYTFER